MPAFVMTFPWALELFGFSDGAHLRDPGMPARHPPPVEHPHARLKPGPAADRPALYRGLWRTSILLADPEDTEPAGDPGVQDPRQRHVLADLSERELVELGEGRLQL